MPLKEEILKSFDERFPGTDGCPICCEPAKETIKLYLSTSITRVIEEVEKRVEGEKVKKYDLELCEKLLNLAMTAPFPGTALNHAMNGVHNKALNTVLQLLKEMKE